MNKALRLMKNQLPNISYNRKGFTLVELLVVISIIAILSVIGITIYTSTQKSARDARRRGDIDAMSKALEAHYDSSTGYPTTIPGSWFTGGTLNG